MVKLTQLTSLKLKVRHKKIIVDLGCGHDKVKPCSNTEIVVGVDFIKTPSVDIVHNLEKPLPFPDNFADQVYSNHVFEHLTNVKQLIEECWRITKPKGTILIRVPHYTSAGMYTDLTHKTFFSSQSFDFYLPETYLSTMGGYNPKIRFKLIKKKLSVIHCTNY